METFYIGLGSNLGDRARNLHKALELLESPDLHIRRVSSIYETEPQGFLDQPWFLNQVAEARTTLSPAQVLERLLAVEQQMGRVREMANGPRLIDLDLLLFGNRTIGAANLNVPHPRMAERRFVLEPLAELAPELEHPVIHRSIRELLASVGDQQVHMHEVRRHE